MLFWACILLVSLVCVVGVGAPFMRSLNASGGEKSLGPIRMVTIGAVAAAPIAAAAVYMMVGAPYSLSPDFQATLAAQQNTPPSLENMTPEDRVAMVESMVSGLAARLQANPDDTEGWRMLARSYGVLGEAEDSAAAYRQLVARDPDATAEDWRNYATAMLAARGPGDGPYSGAFLDALDKLRSFNEDDPLALFYLGLVARDQDEPATALDYWRRLEAILPVDAPIASQLAALIAEAEADAGRN